MNGPAIIVEKLAKSYGRNQVYGGLLVSTFLFAFLSSRLVMTLQPKHRRLASLVA